MARILTVDDQDAVRTAMRRVLEKAGYQVEEASSGGEALLSIARSRPDAVICDVFMAGMDGLDLLTKVKEVAPGIRVVVMSGGGNEVVDEVLRRAVELGADEVLRKPFDAVELLALFKHVLPEGA